MRHKRGNIPAMILSAFLISLLAGCSAGIHNSKTQPAQVEPAQVESAPLPGSSVPVKTQPYKVFGKYYHPLASAKGFKQKGVASWYGKKFHGRKTSNGETYDMYGISAAHKTLPFGTHVRVTNLSNDKQLVVRINDRGPFAKNRIIDLSYGAAKKLGVVGPGTAPVLIEALGVEGSKSPNATASFTPVDFYTGNFTVQIGAFKVRENAIAQRDRLGKIYKNAHISVFESEDGTFYRVRVGKTSSLDEAVKYEEKLINSGFKYAFVVAE